MCSAVGRWSDFESEDKGAQTKRTKRLFLIGQFERNNFFRHFPMKSANQFITAGHVGCGRIELIGK